MNIECKKNNWNQLTISDFKKIKEITSRELDSDMEKSISILSVLCECDEDDLYGLNINALGKLLSNMQWLKQPYTFNKNWNFKHIKIDGEKYDVEVDINKFTVAQYTDFQIYWDKRDDEEYMGRLLTTFIKPHNSKYNEGYDVMELAEKLENTLTINDWNSICFFFLKTLNYSLKGLLIYSAWKMRKVKKNNPELQKQIDKLMEINSII